MKKVILTIAILTLVAGVAQAKPSEVELSIAAVPTNATAVASGTVTNGGYLYGFVDTIILDFGGYASPTCNVDIVTVGSEQERTVFSADDLTSDDVYPVRDIATTTAGVDITGFGTRIPLYQDNLVLRAYAANVTNTITLKAYITITPEPGD